MSTVTKPKHIGRNISRIRELKGIKQEALAFEIGVSQQSVSNIEASENIDDEKLIEIANASASCFMPLSSLIRLIFLPICFGLVTVLIIQRYLKIIYKIVFQ